jgi:hypothetical protein
VAHCDVTIYGPSVVCRAKKSLMRFLCENMRAQRAWHWALQFFLFQCLGRLICLGHDRQNDLVTMTSWCLDPACLMCVSGMSEEFCEKPDTHHHVITWLMTKQVVPLCQPSQDSQQGTVNNGKLCHRRKIA